ncbi:protein RESTRICTED TEV MOVEMENT 2 [Brachypodium distachyon]|uniref:SHSP domain-containing protein n=1 Tax=Brachypodium distachyon TaxID=15368 RepID=I1I4V0_BRADI|nr:protein RESTRICTED TEV MOVEMENT 2 [Brachypodium distachyon]KQJ97174.1 hypothetical protein BRADI_3g29220v3 [Brachypodium distachyon]|eukprot:XP_003571904.1 protein RESTRICTED TEV MOVEMENT 2 [Brachypodium distachyon]
MAAKQHCSTKPASSGAGAAAAGDLDPKFEWIENATNYVLRINLSGFKKDDFRVQVDGAGRLTVRGHRPASGPSFHKVFQLPSTASLDDITGRFDASVLTLTVPKRAAAAAPAPPTTIEEIRKPKAKEEAAAPKPPPTEGAEKKEAAGVKPKEETDKEGALKKALDEDTRKAVKQKEQEEDRRKQEQEQKPSPAAREEEVKPKATEAAAAAPQEKPKPAVAKPAAPLKEPDVASGEKPRQAVDRESLAERVRQRSEEEKAKAAAAAAAAAAEQKKMTSACVAWKERVASELEELAEMKWAQGLVETARNNKEVVATAIAAFSLGFFVSQKLFSRK